MQYAQSISADSTYWVVGSTGTRSEDGRRRYRRRRPVLSTNDSMSTSTHDAKSVTTEGEPITDLRDLRRGDGVVFGDRTRPVEVVDLAVRTKTDERIPKTIETPVVRVQGDWAGAVDRVLAHKLNRLDDGEPALDELDTIVACESDSLDRGEPVTVRRVSESEVGA